MGVLDDLKTFEKIYPIFIQKYETYIPSEENSGVTEKINSMIQYLSQIGRLNNDVVNNWNKVMKWLLEEGLGEVANIEINKVLASGVFDDMLSALVSEQTQELDILVEGKVEELESILVDLRETGTGIDAQAREDLLLANQQITSLDEHKANENEVRLKSVKLELEDASDVFMSAITGGAIVNVLSIPQDLSVSTQKLDTTLTNMLEIITNNLFNGVTVNGSLDSATGILNFATDTTREATDFIPINSTIPINNNWLKLVQPQTITAQVLIFYTASKTFISSVTSSADIVVPPTNASYYRQNIKSGATFSVDVASFIVNQPYSQKLNEIDYNATETVTLKSVLELDNNNAFDGTFVQGTIDSVTGDLIFITDVTRKATGFMEVDPSTPINVNWMQSVIPNTFTEQKMAFYNVNKVFISSVTSTTSVIIPPVGAVYARQNLASGATFSVDLTKYQVYQNRLIDSNRVKTLEKEVNAVTNDVNGIISSLENDLQPLDKNVFTVYDFWNVGKTDSQIIDDCLNFASVVSPKTIIFNQKNWNIDKAILVPSDTEIIVDGVMIKQNNEVYDNVFRGNNLIIDPANPNGFPLSISEIKNVKITGINAAKIEGCDVNKVGVHPILGSQEMVGDYWGWRTLQISFSLGSDIEISGFEITKTRCWSISFDRCHDFYVHDLVYNTTVKNGDGVDVRGGCYNFKIENITGHTHDDTVACTALNIGTVYPVGNYLYPLEPASYLNATMGVRDLDIYNGTIQNITTSCNAFNTRLLCAYGIQIHGMQLNNITGITASGGAVVYIHTGYGGGYIANDIHDIRVNKITSNVSPDAVLIQAKVDNVWLNKIVQNKVDGTVVDMTDANGITITNS